MGQVRRVSADRLGRRSCRTGIRAPRYFVLSVAEELRVAHQEIREIAVIKVARSRIRHEDEKNANRHFDENSTNPQVEVSPSATDFEKLHLSRILTQHGGVLIFVT